MLNGLFDYQKFQNNEKLDSVIEDSLKDLDLAKELSLSELEQISAAGLGRIHVRKIDSLDCNS